MAETYYGKEVSLLSFSKYAKELAPYKLDLRRIFRDWCSLGVNKPQLLGAGTEGEVWELSPSLIFKMHRNQDKYSDLIKLPADPHLSKMRPKIYSSGSFNKKLQWVVMERFIVLDEYDLDLDILIGEVSYYIERTVDLDALSDCNFSIENTRYVYGVVENLFTMVIKEFNECSDFPINKLKEICDRHNLAYNWWPEFVKQVIYLHITDRADDLWLPNLGVSKLGPKKGLFIFFDW